MANQAVVGFILGGGARPLGLQVSDVLSIGREPQNAIVINDVMCSRRHAVVECLPNGRARLRDAGSRNGTFVNGKRLPKNGEQVLHSGDEIRIGGHVLYYVSGGEDEQPSQFVRRATTKLANLETVSTSIDEVAQMAREQGLLMPELEARAGHAHAGDLRKTQEVKPVDALGSHGQHAAQAGPALSGNLANQDLAQIFQFLNTNTKTGDLFVTGEQREGLISFDEGKIFFAEAGDRKGIHAVYALARERSGTFRLEGLEKPPDRPKNVTEPMMQIIFECCKRIDEDELSGH
ncbi:MAG: FHA domain-containing protein [Planctomycetes bacterium]|nr:FHA domain-containing protein [Planctomycetota bacterium]